MDDTVAEFLVESAENLDRLEVDLVELERRPADPHRLAGIFRTVHTIKGTCGFLGFDTLEEVSHAGEALLVGLREGRREVDREVVTALLSMVDALRRILDHIESSGVEPPDDYGGLIATLSALTVPKVSHQREWHDRRARDDRRPPFGDTTVRVEADMLHRMAALVDELAAARDQVVAASHGDLRRAEIAQRLDRVTTELQDCVLQTRTQTIGSSWAKFPRLVRDLATLLGKQVEFEMDGLETRVDRTISEAIRDPLTHMLRNAVDHGLEPPAARLAAGKPAVGRLHLGAHCENGHVHIEVSDDGAGIDPARMRATAVSRGVGPVEAVARLSDRDAIALVFRPGFSTAEQVTSLSGRGVGMDVVRTNIEQVGGRIDVENRVGAGLTFRITIPLTAAVPLTGAPWAARRPT